MLVLESAAYGLAVESSGRGNGDEPSHFDGGDVETRGFGGRVVVVVAIRQQVVWRRDAGSDGFLYGSRGPKSAGEASMTVFKARRVAAGGESACEARAGSWQRRVI